MATLFLVISCKEVKKEIQTPNEKTVKKTENYDNHAGATQKIDDSWVNEIALNRGVKWQANIETTNGVSAMLSLINESKVSTSDDYKKLGDTLNNVKNTVVKECTMKGPSHDNLHVWLHPLIKKIEMLQKTDNTKDGVYLTSKIKKHLEGYYDYFN